MMSFNSKNTLSSSRKVQIVSKAVSLLLLLLFIFFSWACFNIYTFLSTPAEEPGKKIILTVAPGSSFDKVAKELKKANAITDIKKFKLLAKFKGDFKKIKAGDFSIDTNWTPNKVLYQITKGPEILSRLSLPEGLTWWQVARAIEKQKFARYEDFVAVIHDPDFLKEHAIPFGNAEGFLFPDTYFLSAPKKLDREQAKNIASILVKTFWRKSIAVWKRLPTNHKETVPYGYGQAVASIGKDINGVPSLPGNLEKQQEASSRAPQEDDADDVLFSDDDIILETSDFPTEEDEQLQDSTKKEKNTPVTYGQDPSSLQGFTPPTSPANISPTALKHLVTLASLVERETGVAEERPRVAGVYTNRLRIHMLLQCDPTIIYGVGPSFTRPIKRSQLLDESNPYNTYKKQGLPPGPISSVGVPSLLAALMPEVHSYLYFVASTEGRGHTFSATLIEHNKAVRRYRLKNSRR